MKDIDTGSATKGFFEVPYGLARSIKPDVPVYIGEAARRILEAALSFTSSGAQFRTAHHLRDQVTIQIGPFRLTPYLVDHSAYDSYSLLIEAGGKRLFYTGDFRGHGRKSGLFARMLRSPPADVDVLLMEGSSIGRIADGQGFPTETDLEWQLAKVMDETAGMVLVHASGQNIDRLVTAFRACKRAGRTFIIDLYTAEILRATGNERIPQGWWDGMRVFVTHQQRVLVKKNGLHDRIDHYRKNRIYPEALKDIAPKAAMIFRDSMKEALMRAECLSGAHVVWSLWDGYLKDDSMQPFLNWVRDRQVPMTKVHTSGHASVADLKEFAAALAPKRIVPIHSFASGQYPELFANVDPKEDGVWWTV